MTYPIGVPYTVAMIKQEIQKDLVDRISRIEGQLRGVHRMIEEDRGCVDIITQVSAIRQSLASLGVELLKGDAKCKSLGEEYINALFKVR